MMRNLYSLLCAILITGSIFAQGVATNNFKPAQKNINDAKLAKSNVTNNITLRQFVDCATEGAFYCEDFETTAAPAIPADMTTISLEANYYVPAPGAGAVAPGAGVQVSGFYTGNGDDANVGGFYPTGEHTQFAMTNDDACLPANSAPNNDNNCDLSLERLNLPTLDFTGQAGMWILFEYYHDGNYGGGDAYVEVSLDEGASWMDISGPLAIAEAWQTAAYDLSSYEDSSSVSIRITWSDNNSWASGFAVDDIVVNPLPEYAVNMIDQEHAFPSAYFGATTYNDVPLTQATATAYNFIGYLKNLGLNELDSARLYASIASEGFTTESYGINTVSLGQDTFYCNDVFTAAALGTYTADIYGASENGVQTSTESVSFNVTEFDYARDISGTENTYDGGSFINDQGSEQRGNIFDIYADADLYAIKVRIHPATSPNCMAKAVLNSVDVTTGDVSFLTETTFKNVGAYTDDWTNFVFDSPIPLTAGEVILATVYAEFDGIDTLVLANNGQSAIGETLLQDIDGIQTGGAAGDWYYTTATSMVRLNFDPNAVGMVSVNEFEKGNYSIYPNPNNGTFNLSINNNESGNLNLNVQNVLGQSVYAETLNNVSKLNKQINLSNLESGIYTVTITDVNGLSSTEKIIIQ
jgi:hypothetical protein